MSVALVYGERLAEYRFAHGHPMRPERFSLAVELMRGWGLLARRGDPDVTADGIECARVLEPYSASDADLLLFHDGAYIAHVKAASEDPAVASMRFGLGADTPAFAGMHEAAALAVGGTILALDAVLDESVTRAFAPAGGLHHGQRDRASGFCVYNDCAVAIERATRLRPGLRVAYVDIDAHHGDGVEAAFYERDDVFTASIHESGRFLFPGTGAATDTGAGKGVGFALNVPLSPGAGDDDLARALTDRVVPALRDFAPDVIVAQLGGDSHEGDPLTHLAVTIPGFIEAVRTVVACAEELCDGRIVAVGG